MQVPSNPLKFTIYFVGSGCQLSRVLDLILLYNLEHCNSIQKPIIRCPSTIPGLYFCTTYCTFLLEVLVSNEGDNNLIKIWKAVNFQLLGGHIPYRNSVYLKYTSNSCFALVKVYFICT